jgi:ATP-dependent Clp protease ATP-binding subunit ClpC
LYPFERFTERAKQVLTLAQQEAEAAGHSYIGTEHLLLGILRAGESLGCIVLKNLGVELEATRAAITALLSRSPMPIQQLVPTSRVKKVIELSFETAREMGHAYVGTEHLLLGLLTEGEGIAAKVLLDMGVTLDRVSAEIDRLLAEGAAEAPGPPEPAPSQRRPLGTEVLALVGTASTLANRRASTFVGLDHLLDAMVGTSAGIEALARLLEVRRHTAAKEQAIASQDYESASGHRTAEQQAKQALDRAIAAWREELTPPAASEP